MLPFLLFPLETRLEVYEYLPTKTARVADAICLDHFDKTFNHNILCTNKQIRSEAEPILFRDNSYNYYIERNFRRKTYSLPVAHRRLSTTISLCPLLRSIQLHLVIPYDFETSDPAGPETTSLTERMEWTCQVLRETSTLKDIRIAARKQCPPDCIVEGNVIVLMGGVLNLSRKYRKVLAPLRSLPATLPVSYGGEPLDVDDNSSRLAIYDGLCQQLFRQHLEQMLSERVGPVDSSTSPALAMGCMAIADE